MKLIIAEKPKVAQKIAEALSNKSVQRKKGRGQAYYFEFERNGEKIAVAPAVGHLYSLEEKKKTNSYPAFDIDWAPAYQISKESDYTKGYIQTIEDLAKSADEIIIACDFDIEGSLIGYNAMRFAAHRDNGTRMKFSALTKKDLEDAYMGRGDFDLENALAGESRHTLDWYYGINLSRALMSAIKAAGKFQVMSVGRVQGPALKILAEKEKKIQAFVPVPYWELTCEIEKILFKHIKDKFSSEEEAKKCLADSKPLPHKIKEITKKPILHKPNPPFDLTSLQVEAYRHFKFSPKQTQAMAQTLYENSMISYPRTSSQKLPQKLGLDKIIFELSSQKEYSLLAKKLAQNNWFKPCEGKKEDPAHPAIHPTGQNASVGAKERKLYDLIAKRFLACFAPDAKRESQKVCAICGTQEYFTTGGRTLEQGWYEFYAPYVKLEEITLPSWQANQDVQAQNFKIEQKQTQPPKRFTQASIISELESLNLGTKATRATVIDTLFKRGYLKGTKSIEVTQFGLSVIGVLDKYSPDILDEKMTREIEEEMDAITRDRSHAKTVVENGKKILIKTLGNFSQKENSIGQELTGSLVQARQEAAVLGTCPTCKEGNLRKILSRNKKWFAGCSKYPQCTQTYPLPQFGLIEPAGKTCEHDGCPIIRVIRKGSRPFEMCIAVGCPSKANWGQYPKKTSFAKPAQTTPQNFGQGKKTISFAKPAQASAPNSEQHPKTTSFAKPTQTSSPQNLSQAAGSIASIPSPASSLSSAAASSIKKKQAAKKPRKSSKKKTA